MTVAILRPSFPRTPPGELPELMDRPDCDPATLRDAMEAIDRAGRWSGRDRLLRLHLDRLLPERAAGDISLLDVGAGGGHGTLRLARRLGARGWRPRLVLADLHAGALGIARERRLASGSRPAAGHRGARSSPGEPPARRVDLARLSGPALPFRDESFDVSLSTNTLHHLPWVEAAGMLSEMARVARRGMVVVDLRRSRLAYLGTRLLAETVWRRHPLPRHDGPRSVRRAFTPAEAAQLLDAAELIGGEVTARAFWIGIRWQRKRAIRLGIPARPRPARSEARAVGPAEAGA